jgi:Ca2+-binding EF-hand superfamily protein
MGPMISSFLFPSQELNPNEVLFNNDKLQKIMQDFQLTEKDLIAFHKTFRKMDFQGTGYINLDSLYAFIGEELSSSISPYMERFFMLIEKENLDKLTFIEWLPATCVYCLYTDEKIIKFVFNMIDNDQDNFISKKDMMKLLSIERFGKKIFPYNYVKAIETLEVVRGDKISNNDFRKLHLTVPFMCFPAFYLQKCFRANILGRW